MAPRHEAKEGHPSWPQHSHPHSTTHTHSPTHTQTTYHSETSSPSISLSQPSPGARGTARQPSSLRHKAFILGEKGAGGTWVKGAGAMVLHSLEPQTKLNRCVPPLTSVGTHAAWGGRGSPQCRLATWPQGQVEILVSRWILLSLFLLQNEPKNAYIRKNCCRLGVVMMLKKEPMTEERLSLKWIK